jgi:hypothetical protein
MKNFLIGLVLIALCATPALATLPTNAWEFDQHPEQDWPGTLKVNNGYYDGPVVTGLNGDGTATFKDSGATANNAYISPKFAGDYTVDLMIDPVLDAGPGNDAAMGGIGYNDAVTGNKGHGLRFDNGPPGVMNIMTTRGAPGIFQVAGISCHGDNFATIRLSVTNDAGTIKVYLFDLENDTDPGPGVNYAPLNVNDAGGNPTGDNFFTIIDAGGSNPPYNKTPYGTGYFTLMSRSKSIVQQGEFNIDYARFKNGTALGATDPAMVPEPVTLMLLVLGMLPMLRRRR